MRALTLLPLLYLPTAFAAPGGDHDTQAVFGKSAALADTAYGNNSQHVVHNGGNVLQEDNLKVETWSEEGTEFIKQNGLVCTSSVSSKLLSAQPVIF
jgi:hypothetical protein